MEVDIKQKVEPQITNWENMSSSYQKQKIGANNLSSIFTKQWGEKNSLVKKYMMKKKDNDMDKHVTGKKNHP